MGPSTAHRFFGRRSGRPLSNARRELISDVLPEMEITCRAATNIDGIFDSSIKKLCLEIGFGAGEHLADMVIKRPEVGFIGCEPFINGVAALLAQTDSRDLKFRPKNLKIFPDDARLLLPHLPSAIVDQIYVLFPDPWPKKRHHGRRLICSENLDQFSRLLRPGGVFYFASDHMSYVRWTLQHLVKHSDFDWLADGPCDWRFRFKESIKTRYERKALSSGFSCVYLTFRRRRQIA